MIHPTFQVSEEIYIHAAREAVWARWIRIGEWPRWRSDVSLAKWLDKEQWREGATFVLQPANGVVTQQRYLIRMVVPADTTVWENNSRSQGVVYTLHLADQVGGCKVALRCIFHGWGSLLKRFNAVGEKARLHTLLTALKMVVEQPDSRR
ncbi:MAG: hypothetical protein DYG89_08390 [Caldilinea sp. CFX5]|nr:hypothetical protein [Caldilinea sp. CFX5]